MIVMVGERSRPLTFDELAPMLQEEAHKHIYNKLKENAMMVKDKGSKGKPKDSQLRSNDANKAWKKNIKCQYCEMQNHTTKECRKKKVDLKQKKEVGDVDSKFEIVNVTIDELFLTKH